MPTHPITPQDSRPSQLAGRYSHSLLRTLWSLLALAFATASLAAAQTSLPAPVLIPYTTVALAGNAQQATGGYSGDGGKGVGTTLNAPTGVAVDSTGNVYIADTSNAVIREINAQTGTMKIIAGLPPTKCTQTLCTAQTAYTDAVPATSVGIGSGTKSLAVDGFGNVYFSDTNQQDLRVIYKGGTQLANLIALEDPTGAPTASAVVPGNIYLLAGKPTSGTKGTTSPVADKVLATSATFHNIGQIGLDLAGNIYIQDVANDVARVINAQPTAQTFFGVTLQPGYIGAIVGCSAALTVPCTSSYGIGQAPNLALNGVALAGLAVDKYGNVYETDTKGADPIYGGVAYSSGAELAHLLYVEAGTTATPNTWYSVLNANPNNTAAVAFPTDYTAALAATYNSFVIRPSALTVDSKGNIYYLDNHWPALYRIDVNSQLATRLSANTSAVGTPAAPAACTTATLVPPVTATTTDKFGDGCPSTLASLSGNGTITTDAAGNVYLADPTEFMVRELKVNNQFPATAVGTPVTQTLQLHFDASNLPATTTPTTTSPLTIASGTADFAILTAPVCENITSVSNTTTQPSPLDASIDCYVNVTFTPTLPGLRTASLQATTTSGAVYNFALTGTGTGSQLAVDGGNQVTLPVTGLGTTSSLAIDAQGNKYIADPANNRVVALPVTGTQTTIGTGLSNPQGVAVDAVGNVYIADTGNNRVVEVNIATAAQTTLLTGLSSPQGLTVGPLGNVYIADTGNARVVEIPANSALSVSTLEQFSAANSSSGLKSPVAVATDSLGNLYVADPGSKSVFELAPGGGDLQTVVGPTSVYTAIGANFKSPNGVAVDAAGNVYISDSGNNFVAEKPSSTGPGSEQFNLSFTGLSSPAGLALDAQGNLYVADSGNKQIVEMPRYNTAVNFGSLGLFEPAYTDQLTVSNIGNLPITLASPTVVASGATTNYGLTDSCSGTVLLNGLTCGLATSYLPLSSGSSMETLTIAGGAGAGGVTASLSGVGVAPLGAIALNLSTPPVTGGTTAAITATVTQPHGTNTPTGTVTFTYTINEGDPTRGGSTTSQTINLVPGAGGASTAVLNLTGLLPARRYAIIATYNGDPQDTANTSSELDFIVPGGITLTVVSNSVSFNYGAAVPTLTGTVTGILPADASAISYKFVTTATSTTPVGAYPITLVLSGGNYLNYVIPPAVTSSGSAAVVTENPAPLSVVVGNFTTVYGSQNITYTSTVTGAVNGDVFTVSYSPAASGTLPVGTYTLVPTLAGPASNYAVKVTNGQLIVTQAATNVSLVVNATSVLPTNLSSEQVTATVTSSTSGTPTGTVTITDAFTALQTATTTTSTIGPLTLTNGVVSYSPTSPTDGTHVYTIAYSGDSNFQPSSLPVGPSVIVDTADFLLATSSSPLAVIPGVIPGGNASISGESSANPEQQTITFTPILNYKGTITLTCAAPASYITCTLSPSTVVISTTTAQSTTISVSTPATLPANFTGKLNLPGSSRIVLAFLPLGLLALVPLGRRRRWRVVPFLTLVALFGLSVCGVSGCGSSQVKFYTPVPQGPITLTVTATDGTLTRVIPVAVTIQ